MKTQKNTLMFIALFAALVTFACGGGAVATSTPEAVVTPAMEPTELPTQIEGELEITNATSYVDGFNDYTVVGEIENNTNKTLENITLSLSISDESGAGLLKDENDNPVDSIEIQPYIGVLDPGVVAPFSYYISADEVQPANFDVSIKSYDQSSAPELADINIDHVNLTETESGDILITGEVVNLSSEHVELESVAGAVLDASTNILAANFTLTYSRYLYPSGDAQGRDRSPFIVQLYGPIANIAHWKVYARGVESSPTSSADMDIQVSTAYFDAYGTYHLLGTLTNSGSSQLSPSLIGTLYNTEKILFDVASLNVPFYVDAGQSVPFDFTSFQVINYVPAEQVESVKPIIQPDPYWTFKTDYELVSLEAQDVDIAQDGYDWVVSGKAVNTSDTNLSSISAVVQFLDENGQVLATNSVSMYPPEGSETIEPGTSNEFSVSIYVPEDWDLSSKEYQVVLQGLVSE